MPLRALCLWPCCRRGFTLLSRREYGETEKAEELQELQEEPASSDLNLSQSLATDTSDRREEIPEERRSLIKEKVKRETVTGVDQGIIMQGWLFKEVQHNVKAPWLRVRKHWFVLTQDSLDYYTNNELNAKRLGMLVLTSLCSVLWPDKGTYKGTGYWNITVYGRKHHYQLYTKHLNQCIQWACAIQNVINCKAPVETPTLLLIQDIEENCTNSEVLENIYKWNPILQHTQNPLYSPLLPFPYGIGAHHLKNTKGYTTLHDEAVKVFNSLQHLETEQDPIPLIQGILQTCLDLEALRDEIYCQLIKQTSNPPHVGSISDLRNWQLLTCMSVTFLPSNTVLKYLRFHIKRSQDQFPETEVYKYAEFIADSLVRTKCRKRVPSCEEILVLMRREEMSCTIHYAGSKFCRITISSHSTAGEVVNSLLVTLGLRQSRNRFALFEQNLTDQWLVADDTVVADIITRFENLAINVEEPENQWKLYFKLYCFLDSDNIPKNNLEFALLFEQVHEMVTKGYFPASEETLLALAALRLQFTIRDFTTHVPLPKLQELFPMHILQARVQQSVKALLSTNSKGLSHLLPGTLASSLWGSTTQKQKLEEEQLLKVRLKEEAATLMATIVEQWKQLPGMTQLEAMTTYLSIVREWSGYGATLFEVGAFMNSAVSVAQTLWLAVGAKGLALYKQGDVESVENFDYRQISSFEVTERNTFKITLRKKDLLFESCKAQEIVQLITIYNANHFKTSTRSGDHRSRPIITGSLSNSHHCNLHSDSSTEEA